MTDPHHDWLTEQPAATLLLAAYAEREAQLPRKSARAESAAVAAPPQDFDGDALAGQDDSTGESENADAWIPRLAAVEGIDSAILSPLHGGLIARGLLKYELFIKHGGMRYRLTPEGRRAAEREMWVIATSETTAEKTAVAA